MNQGKSGLSASPSLELRHLGPRERRELSALLDTGEGWRELAATLRRPDGQQGYLFTSSNIRILEQQKHVPGGSPSQALFDYWATMGRKRPTIADLVQVLNDCRLFRAADYVSVQLLGRSPVDRETTEGEKTSRCPGNEPVGSCPENGSQSSGNGATHCQEVSFSEILVPLLEQDEIKSSHDINCNVDSMRVEPTAPSPSLASLEDNSLCGRLSDTLGISRIAVPQYSYADLQKATNNFSEVKVSEGGHKLGEGAFGFVFRANLPDHKLVAIKQLKIDIGSPFLTNELNEVNFMIKFNHENLLPLLGVSSDGPALCLVFEYMPNGSLLDRLASGESPIRPPVRLGIAIGAARGLCYLHTFDETPFVHRDVKSANVLLDSCLVPKLGDFGLVRLGTQGSGQTTSKNLTQNIIGTSVYMAPEAFRGDVSVKLDTFSFGVVLLELLTGLEPYDETREEPDLLSLVEETVDTDKEANITNAFTALLDTRGGHWDLTVASGLFTASRLATEQRKKNRPTMVQMLPLLEKLRNKS